MWLYTLPGRKVQFQWTVTLKFKTSFTSRLQSLFFNFSNGSSTCKSKNKSMSINGGGILAWDMSEVLKLNFVFDFKRV